VTITSWNRPPEVDLAALFAKPAHGGSVTGSGFRSGEPAASALTPGKTVALSDGTEITFSTTSHFTVLDTV
jgi:hypothetical protein